MKSIVMVGQQPTVDPPDMSMMVCIDYVNYRGERAVRRIVPQRLFFGKVEWHAGQQWILDAWDIDKSAIRSFAVGDICQWGV